MLLPPPRLSWLDVHKYRGEEPPIPVILKGNWRLMARREQLPPEGDWHIWVAMAGRGFGKALALDTLVPTPSGYTTMGALQSGDELFDEFGEICQVQKAHEILFNRKCYKIEFSDGTTIIADADHLWQTMTKRERKQSARGKHMLGIRTTQQIKDSLLYWDEREINHSVDCCAPLELPEMELSIDPYVLGAWLGDGNSINAGITCQDSDRMIINLIAHFGYDIRVKKIRTYRNPTYGIGSGLQKELHKLNLINNKHVPEHYFRASAVQRIRLLQGLMDTDGYINQNGNCEFCSTRIELADAVYELCVTLGIKTTIIEGRSTLNGIDHGPKYRVCFTPYIPVFQLPRKRKLVKKTGAQSSRQSRRYIIAVDDIPSVPVRCITVDSVSSLYLVTKSMIPTHNTKLGAEWIHEKKRQGIGRMALVAPTAADARDVLVEGQSGILATAPNHDRPTYEPTKRRITWPNGAMATTFSADEPDRLRGPQHEAAWCDEIAAWRYLQEAWDMLMFGLRLGLNPQVVATTTPRPLKLLKELVKREREGSSVIFTRGSTYDNLANLAPTMAAEILARYEGTRLGRQEIYGELLQDFDGALWTQEMIEQAYQRKLNGTCERIVVSIDPAVTVSEGSASTGIVVAGKIKQKGYILEDGSIKGSPEQWASKAIKLYNKYSADTIVAEKNQGGDMITHTIHTINKNVPVKLVHAAKGKMTRAEPIASLYEQNLIKHIGRFPDLEDEMCSFVPGEPSPDRFDAAVWALTELMIGIQNRSRALHR